VHCESLQNAPMVAFLVRAPAGRPKGGSAGLEFQDLVRSQSRVSCSWGHSHRFLRREVSAGRFFESRLALGTTHVTCSDSATSGSLGPSPTRLVLPKRKRARGNPDKNRGEPPRSRHGRTASKPKAVSAGVFCCSMHWRTRANGRVSARRGKVGGGPKDSSSIPVGHIRAEASERRLGVPFRFRSMEASRRLSLRSTFPRIFAHGRLPD